MQTEESRGVGWRGGSPPQGCTQTARGWGSRLQTRWVTRPIEPSPAKALYWDCRGGRPGGQG